MSPEILPPIPETVMMRLRDHLRDQFPATRGNIRLQQLLQAVEDEIATAWSNSNWWRAECTRWGELGDQLRAEIEKLRQELPMRNECNSNEELMQNGCNSQEKAKPFAR